jgi:predicted Zn finger-like uncharacterized protein
MKLTCPGCAAKYTIRAERLEGRRGKIRCKRCDETILVDPIASGEVCTPRSGAAARVRKDESRRATADLFAGLATAGAEEPVPNEAATGAATEALIGQRHENSLLFSLSTLSATASERGAAAAATTTESSSLIDIRALCGAIPEGAPPSSRTDDIMNLSGGGAFAPLLAPPLVTLLPPEEVSPTPNARTTPLWIGAAALALVATAVVVTIVTIGRTREPRTSSPVERTEAPAVATSSSAPTLTSAAPGALAANEPPTPTQSAPFVASTRPVARGSARTSEAPPAGAPAPSSATTAPTKCCHGESETTCAMRLSVGAPCGDARSTSSTPTGAAPFDRPAAARALGVSVSTCKRADGPTGPGHARVTFQPSGAVSAVDVEAPYAGTAVGACVAQRLQSASVPAFTGGALTVGKTFAIP